MRITSISNISTIPYKQKSISKELPYKGKPAPNLYLEEEKNKLLQIGVGSFCLIGALFSINQILSIVENFSKYFSKPQNTKKTKDYLQKITFNKLANDIPKSNECKILDRQLNDISETLLLIKNNDTNLVDKLGLTKTNRILLSGKPGIGKTYYSKILARDLDAYYAEFNYKDINSKWIGEHIEKMDYIFKDIIQSAKENPRETYIITLNEIDSLMTPIENLTNNASHSTHGMVKEEIRSVFLEYLDNISEKCPNIIMIGTTNLKPSDKKLDAATLSRFQEVIELPMPNSEALYQALINTLNKSEYTKAFLEKNKDSLKKFSKLMEEKELSFRDLDSVIKKSKEACFKDLLKDNNKKYEISYLEKALNEIKITDGKTS